MNMPHGDRSCGKVNSIAAEDPAVAFGAPAGCCCAGAIMAGAAAGEVGAAVATGAAAAGASTVGAVPAGCSWAAALAADRMTATNAANKPFLDKSFFLVFTAASRFLFPAASAYCT
ncbi:hypothetical protein NL534_25000 [Mesorhizobium opportunistum]|nr:hypothetical protein NL534_25000 [Mesorhizobium opportunistum]